MYKINEVFELFDKKYQVKVNKNPSMCIGCAGDFSDLCIDLPECEGTIRKDKIEVIFKELK